MAGIDAEDDPDARRTASTTSDARSMSGHTAGDVCGRSSWRCSGSKYQRRIAPERAGIATYTYRRAVYRLRRHADRPVRFERVATAIPPLRTVNGASAEPRGGPGWAVSVDTVASRLGDRWAYTACGSPSHDAVIGGPMGKRGAPTHPVCRYLHTAKEKGYCKFGETESAAI